MTKTEQLRIIREAFADIPELQDGFWEVSRRLFDMNMESERGHRRHKPYNLPSPKFSVADAARLFTVSHLLDGFAQPERFSIDDITHIRLECLYAQAYAKRYHKELEPWAAKWAEAFKNVDYVELVKVAA